MEHLLSAVGAGVLGLLLGPWLVTCVRRIPADPHVSVFAAPTCPACDAPTGGRVQLPLRRAACTACGAAPPGRDRAVHVVTSLLFALVGSLVGLQPGLPAVLFLAGACVVVTFVDLDTHRIPDRITLRVPFVALALIAGASWAEGSLSDVTGALVGAVAFAVVIGVFALVYPAGMGLGDAKWAPTLGLYLGWVHPVLVVYALLAASVIGIAVGLPTALRKGRRAEFPFGPALCAGTLLVLFAGDRIVATVGV